MVLALLATWVAPELGRTDYWSQVPPGRVGRIPLEEEACPGEALDMEEQTELVLCSFSRGRKAELMGACPFPLPQIYQSCLSLFFRARECA